MKTVGKNPNLTVRNSKIFLKGQGSFKGKILETILKAKDFFK